MKKHEATVEMDHQPVLLELFSGTGSVGKAFKAKGWRVFSVDISPRGNPTFCGDVLEVVDARASFPKPTVIWASPPCTNYSVARRRVASVRQPTGLLVPYSGSNDVMPRLRTVPAVHLEHSDALVRKTLEIAVAFGEGVPLFIENPWTGGLKSRGLLDHLTMRKVDYCKYGMPYRKRTAIWTNTDWEPSRPLCRHDCCASTKDGKHLARAQQGPPGPRFTQWQLYRIPEELCDEIAEFCDVVVKGND